MKKTIVLSLTAVALVAVMTGLVNAQSGHPSAKATAKVGDIAIIPSTEMGWTTILYNTLKTPNQKDLFVDVSLECGLHTKTKVVSAGKEDKSTAEAGVKVRVLVDGVPAHPGEVVFCRRTQELTAKFGGIMQSCTDTKAPFGSITRDECTWTDEELELVLDTMNANAFNFVEDDLSAGVHTIWVQAKIDTAVTQDRGEAAAWATIGNGSVIVEEVRMIKNEGFLLE
jgi:hypothetical protein